MPRRTPHRLQWSEQAQAYEIATTENASPQQSVSSMEELARWLETISSFAFQSRTGAYCTLRQETVQGSGAYWYAYRSIQHKTVKHYAGRLEDLSLARLEEIAARFTEASSLTHSEERQEHTSSASRPLLETKHHPPRLPLGLVERPRLLRRLDAYQAHQLTLLSAPAGYGKSTLVNHWRTTHQDSAHLSWISLDNHDNNPVHFWHTVLKASNLWHPTFDESMLTMHLSAGTPTFSSSTLEAALTAFLNQADRQKFTGALILDNYHMITEPRIHETLDFFLSHLPETLHIILLTRTEPPIPLARLRANGELNEIQTVELRFTQSESATFLERTVEYDLSSELLERIEAQVEGWAAGLRLLALSLHGKAAQATVEQVLAAFHGKHRPIRDYFVTEVLRAQSEVLQDFLLRTSLLKRFNAALCCEVTGRKESMALLETIERDNLFLEALDSTGEWYHYQALFAEAMEHEARQRLGKYELSRIARLASHWFEQEGLLVDAIETSFQSDEIIHTAELLEQYVETISLHETAEHQKIRRWLEQLPVTLLEQRPTLCLAYANALIFSRTPQSESVNFGRIEELLARGEELWRAADDFVGVGKIFAIRATFIYLRERREQALALSQQALAWLPPTEPIWRGICLATLGMDALQMGELSTARHFFEEIRELWRDHVSVHLLDGITLLLGIIYFEQGKLYLASRSLQELYTISTQHQNHAVAAIVQLMLAQISYEWNDLELAERQMQETLRPQGQVVEIPQEFFQLPIELTAARIQYAHGERVVAIQRLETLLSYQMTAGPFMYIYQEAATWLIRHELNTQNYDVAQNKFDAFLRHQAPEIRQETNLLAPPAGLTSAQTSQTTALVAIQKNGDAPVIFQVQRALIIVRLAIARGEVEAALLTLTQLLPEARDAGRGRVTLQILLLIAQTYAARQQTAEAQQALLEGLSLGQLEGYQRTILDEGELVSQLLRDLLPQLRNQPLHSYVTKLLHAFAQTQTHQATIITPDASPLYEPLSPQEQRVLRLLAAGNSNAEIANELVVSINTIRTQVQSIYHKLQVNNRHAASNIARSLRLIT